MGWIKRAVVPRPVRKATRIAKNPVRSARRAVTSKPLKEIEDTIRHPLSTLLADWLRPASGRRGERKGSASTVRTEQSAWRAPSEVGQLGDSAVDQAYRSITSRLEGLNRGQPWDVLPLAKNAVRLLPAVDADDALVSIPAIEIGAGLLAAAGDRETLLEWKGILDAQERLSDWRPLVEEALEDEVLAAAIIEAVAGEPGVLQKDLSFRLGNLDKGRVRSVCYLMSRLGILERTKAGATYTVRLREGTPLRRASGVASSEARSTIPIEDSLRELTPEKEAELLRPIRVDLNGPPPDPMSLGWPTVESEAEYERFLREREQAQAVLQGWMAEYHRVIERRDYGWALQKAGETERACALYEANVAEGIDEYSSYDRLARLYHRAGRIQDEIRVLERAIAIYGASHRANAGLAGVLERFHTRLAKAHSGLPRTGSPSPRST